MDGLTQGLLILVLLGLLGLAAVLVVFCGVSILAALIGRAMLRQGNPKVVALLASAVLPMVTVLLLLLAILAALEPDFRGPEIIGIAIVGIIATFSVLVGWPISYLVTRRVLGNR